MFLVLGRVGVVPVAVTIDELPILALLLVLAAALLGKFLAEFARFFEGVRSACRTLGSLTLDLCPAVGMGAGNIVRGFRLGHELAPPDRDAGVDMPARRREHHDVPVGSVRGRQDDRSPDGMAAEVAKATSGAEGMVVVIVDQEDVGLMVQDDLHGRFRPPKEGLMEVAHKGNRLRMGAAGSILGGPTQPSCCPPVPSGAGSFVEMI